MKRIKFYKMCDTDRKAFAQACGFGPLPDGMPFLHPEELKLLKMSWEVSNLVTPGLIVDGGKIWPDFLFKSGWGPRALLSQKIIDSLVNEKISIARITHMPIAKVEAPRLLGKAPPKYYVLEALPGIEIDYTASGIPVSGDGNPDYSGIAKRPPNALWFLRAETWNGTDLMGWQNPAGRPSSQLIVSQRVVDLAERDGWTNVKFDPIWAS